MNRKQTHIHFLARIGGLPKLLFCIILAFLLFGILTVAGTEMVSRIILGWDMFSLSMILISLGMFVTTSGNELSDVVERQDDGLQVIFAVVLFSVCFSLFGTLYLMLNKSGTSQSILHTLVYLSPVFLSWFLLHILFTIRYAHLYNDHNKLNTGSDIGGLNFPNSRKPDYMDFAYFSFVIGMTFQVSDVTIQSPVIRRFVLLHSLISFMFNTMIVALTINTLSNLNS